MSLPIVAIVGRPNVGKSTLFNRIVGFRKAIVHDHPGVTRDRVLENADWIGQGFTVIDTGGFDPGSEDLMKQHINRQIELAAEMADVLFFVVDGKEGLTGLDQECARHIRTLNKPTYLVVNKMERELERRSATDFFELGWDEPYYVSAEHGTGVAELLDSLVGRIPAAPTPDENPPYCSVAIIGKPNVGKSSLVNRLVGEERCIVTDIPGTTRDSVDTDFTYFKKRWRVVDTAGLRRKNRVTWALEKLTVLKAMHSVERSDVVLVVLDASSHDVTEQDAKIAGIAHELGKAVVVLVNKWDLIPEKDTNLPLRFEERLREQFKFLSYAPVLFISCLTGQRLHKVLETVQEIRELQQVRIPANELTAVINNAMEGMQAPARVGGRRLKVYYATQVHSAPPTFVMFCNDPNLVHFSYERYLINQIRAKYPFPGMPLRFVWKARERSASKKT